VEKERCTLVDGKRVEPSDMGGIPCELCLVLDTMDKSLNALLKKINTSEAVIYRDKLNIMIRESKAMKDYKAAVATHLRLSKSHKKCKGCGMCFGGEHLAFVFTNLPGFGDICEWCANELKENGRQAFIERRKPNYTGLSATSTSVSK
jgi:hypothetical protein